MKVEQFKVKNQFIIRDTDKVIFQSYNSTIAMVEKIGLTKRQITLGADWNYSTTTSKYLYMFLEEEAGFTLYNINNKRAYIEKLIKEITTLWRFWLPVEPSTVRLPVPSPSRSMPWKVRSSPSPSISA